MILSGMQTSEIARLTGRKGTAINSQRCRLIHKANRVCKPYGYTSKPGCSYYAETYSGPEGWNVDQGPPCLLCILHHNKIDDNKGKLFRSECRSCQARITWADHNAGGVPQSYDYCEVWPEHLETEDLVIF
jgi:hypothetical protein